MMRTSRMHRLFQFSWACLVSASAILLGISTPIEGRVNIQTNAEVLGESPTSNIVGIAEIAVFASEGGEPVWHTVLIAEGEMPCVAPGADVAGRRILDRSTVHHVAWAENISIKARPAKTSAVTIIAAGRIPVVLKENERGEGTGIDCSALFLPGVLWEVTESIQFGQISADGSPPTVLQPGRYEVGPYGVPHPRKP